MTSEEQWAHIVTCTYKLHLMREIEERHKAEFEAINNGINMAADFAALLVAQQAAVMFGLALNPNLGKEKERTS